MDNEQQNYQEKDMFQGTILFKNSLIFQDIDFKLRQFVPFMKQLLKFES